MNDPRDGDRIQFRMVDECGRKAEVLATLRVSGGRLTAVITPGASGGQLREEVEVDLVAEGVCPVLLAVEAQWLYIGRHAGAVFVPSLFWRGSV